MDEFPDYVELTEEEWNSCQAILDQLENPQPCVEEIIQSDDCQVVEECRNKRKKETKRREKLKKKKVKTTEPAACCSRDEPVASNSQADHAPSLNITFELLNQS